MKGMQKTIKDMIGLDISQINKMSEEYKIELDYYKKTINEINIRTKYILAYLNIIGKINNISFDDIKDIIKKEGN